MDVLIEIDEQVTQSAESLKLCITALLKSIRYSCSNPAESLAQNEVGSLLFIVEQLIEKIPTNCDKEP